jgi:ATP-dependent protease ClpP protease subunit
MRCVDDDDSVVIIEDELTSNMMLKDTYLTAQQALELGLISKII